MADKPTGLKFILQGGAFVQTVLPEARAVQIVRNFLDGSLALKDVPRLGDLDDPQGSWAVRVDAVLAVHTFPVEPQPEPQPAPRGIGRPYLSGN